MERVVTRKLFMLRVPILHPRRTPINGVSETDRHLNEAKQPTTTEGQADPLPAG